MSSSSLDDQLLENNASDSIRSSATTRSTPRRWRATSPPRSTGCRAARRAFRLLRADPDAIERAWVYGSLQFGDGAVRSATCCSGC
jgi:hypothetical protein